MSMAPAPTLDLDNEYPLTSVQRERYRRDGFIVLPGVISPEELAVFRPLILDRVARATRDAKPISQRDDYGKMFLQVMHLWDNEPAIAPLSLSRRLGKIVADLMDVPTVRIFHDQALFKEPGGAPTAWHQDQYYIPFSTDHILTCWIPMVDLSEAMGTMSFAAGSHKCGQLYDGPTTPASGAFFEQRIAEEGWRAVNCGAMRAGDASFHAGWTVHSAPGNTSDQMREVMNMVYFADGARLVARGPWEGASRFHLRPTRLGDLIASDIQPIVYSE